MNNFVAQHVFLDRARTLFSKIRIRVWCLFGLLVSCSTEERMVSI